MRILVLLTLCATPVVSSRSLRHVRVYDHRGQDHDRHGRTNPIDDLVESAQDAAEAAGNTLEKVEGAISPVFDRARPLMSKINKMRIELCWKRDDLWSHEECMDFLGLKCKSQSTGEGFCNKFREKVARACKATLNSKYCDKAKELGVEVDDSETTPKPAEADIHDDDVDVVENDVDINDANVEEAPLADGDAEDTPDEPDSVTSEIITEDRDGDGVPDDEDAFPDDANEWSDLDEDGIGNNSDPDKDGDGVANDKDAFPDDKSRHARDAEEADRDGDGWPDSKDAFPDDPLEWQDSDGDGYGDNKDAHPTNADCWKEPCEVGTIKPWMLDKNEERPGGLPSQGYDEHSLRWVKHNDMETWTSDWRQEWPKLKESEKESIVRICMDNPRNVWCRRYYHHGRFAR